MEDVLQPEEQAVQGFVRQEGRRYASGAQGLLVVKPNDKQFEASGMLRRFKGVNIGDVGVHRDNRNAVGVVLDWLKEFQHPDDGSLHLPQWAPLLSGPAGVGKTMLACALGNALISHRGWHVRFATARRWIEVAEEPRRLMEMIQLLEKAGEEGSDAYVEEVKHLYAHRKLLRDITGPEVDLLIIDDLGTEYRAAGSEWTQHLIENLLRERGGQLLPTMVTTNLTGEEMHSRYGDHFYSYLNEICKVAIVEGNDRRTDR